MRENIWREALRSWFNGGHIINQHHRPYCIDIPNFTQVSCHPNYLRLSTYQVKCLTFPPGISQVYSTACTHLMRHRWTDSIRQLREKSSRSPYSPVHLREMSLSRATSTISPLLRRSFCAPSSFPIAFTGSSYHISLFTLGRDP
jgi:hypothetical protein